MGTLERGGSSAVGRGRAGRPAGPTTTNSTAAVSFVLPAHYYFPTITAT